MKILEYTADTEKKQFMRRVMELRSEAIQTGYMIFRWLTPVELYHNMEEEEETESVEDVEEEDSIVEEEDSIVEEEDSDVEEEDSDVEEEDSDVEEEDSDAENGDCSGDQYEHNDVFDSEESEEEENCGDRRLEV